MKTSILAVSLFIIFTLIFYACNSSKKDTTKLPENYHMEKKYWGIEDYDAAFTELRKIPEGQKLPNYSDAITAMVFSKIIDINNVSVVVEDTTLGISHRTKFATEMLDYYRTLCDYYGKLDREDKFIYPSEMVDIVIFGVYIQIYDFKLGNENILKESINPNNYETKDVLSTNAQTIVDNMRLSIDYCKKENALTPDACHRLAIGLDKYLPLLFKYFPSASYSELKSQVEMLLSTVKSNEIKQMLLKVKDSIDKIGK
jgi:hypothetical protein